MKLAQLDALIAVVESGGIRAAARRLHLSQAAVTKAMRTLEQQAGVPLLVRRTRGIALTAAGERLLARARVITRQVALAREEIAQGAGEDHGTVRIGVTPYLTLTALGQAFAWFRQRYQRVQVQLIEGLMARVLPRLRDGTLDIAAVAADVGEVAEDEFTMERLARVPQRVVARQGHPVLARPSAQALSALEWVLTQPMAPGSGSPWAPMFDRAGVPVPERVVQCETLAAMTLLRHSDAVSIFPEPLLGHPESRGIVAVPRAALKPADVELLLLTQREVPLTPAAEYFLHCLRSVATGGAAARRPPRR